MRTTCLIALLAGLASAAPDRIRYRDAGLESALTEAKARERPVLVVLTARECDCVEEINGKALADPSVAAYANEHFVPIRLDLSAGASEAAKRRYGLAQDAPAFLFLAPGGDEIDRERGVVSREGLLRLLQDVAAGRHFAALERRVAAGEESYDFLVAYGRRLCGRGSAGAADILRKAISLDPEEKRPPTVEASYLLARLAVGDDLVRGLAAFAAAHPESPRATEAHATLATSYEARGRTDEAIASYEFLRTRGALDPPWRKHDYARLLAWNGRDVEIALALVTEALRAAPDEPRWLDTKAECLSRLGRYGEAVEVEERALAKAQRLEERAEFGRALYELRKRAAEARR